MATENDHVGDHPDASDEDIEEEEDKEKDIDFKAVLQELKNQQLRDVMESLPPSVKRRIKALKKIQLEATNIEAKFFEEVHQLECKYHAQYVPLYEKRHSIITGKYEPTDEEAKWQSDDEDEVKEVSNELKKNLTIEGNKTNSDESKKNDKAAAEDVPVKGVPGFWLTVFNNVSLLADMIQEHDEPILKHLMDIKLNVTEKPMGFTLEFHFEPNEYFTNTVLTKEYLMKCEPDDDDPFGFEGPEIVKCKGCTINWNSGKDITKKTIKKRQKHKNRGVTRTITKVVANDSFFNFFNPPAIPDDINAGIEDEDIRSLITTDFEIGHYIRDRVVPRAVLFFTGEAVEDNDDDYEEESEAEDVESGESANEQCKQQ